ITKVLTTLLGEQGIGPAAAMVPFWFYEGDAIYAETTLSRSGRGRSPQFEMRLKAHLLNDQKIWSFSKMYLGSYKNYVPDYYQFGYQMVSYAREKYGADFWTKGLDYTGRNIFFIDPLGIYLKKETGKAKSGLYDSAMHFIKNHWEEQRKTRLVVNYKPVNKKQKLYTSYNHPQITEEGFIIAIKSSLDRIDRFVQIDSSGNETLVHIPGRLYSGRISYNDDRIIWDEYLPGMRWTNVSHSILKEYNIQTGKLRYITRLGRYSSPAYSPSGDTIITVETDISNNFSLVFLSMAEGKELLKVPSPGNIQIISPAWQENSNKIIVTGLDEEGKKLLQYDRNRGIWEELLSTKEINISDPVWAGDYILFNGSFNGIDNIFAFNLKDKNVYQLSHSEFGAFQPDFSKDLAKFSFANYSSNGYNAVLLPFKKEHFKLLEKERVTEQPFFQYGKPSAEIEPPGPKNKDPLEEDYNGLKKLFKFHSWSPFYFDYTDPDLENPSINPGITLLSQNLLSTAITSIGYEYTEGDHFLHTRFTYKGWVPVIDVSHSFGGLPRVIQYKEVPQPEKVSTASNLSIHTFIPLTLYSGKWISGFQPSLRITYNNDYFYYVDEASYQKGICYAEPRLYFYTFQRTAYRDLQPRWGVILDLNSIATPFEKEQRGTNRAFKTTLYFPGFIRGQGLKIKGEWQKQDPERYLFGNLVSFARGYEPRIGLELSKYSIDYRSPLFYPDLNIDGLFYLKRVRANLFADYIYGKDMREPTEEEIKLKTGSFVSTGLELNFDYHIFRMLIPLSSGIRASYLDNTKAYRFELLFNFYLNGF
ncbi:MAG: hypothetical protein ACOCZL_04895, partial [Bacteroidota bacterium]